MSNAKTRRNFLLTAPLAAAAASPLTDTLLRASAAAGQSGTIGLSAPFEVLTAETMLSALKDVQASHGTRELLTSKGTAMVMILNEETKKAAKEFEYHAHRDHVFHVLDGETTYELGGTPKNAREIKPGEYLAPESEGYKSVGLKKGDYLSVPRMTPHRRVTDGSVSLLLISAITPA